MYRAYLSTGSRQALKEARDLSFGSLVGERGQNTPSVSQLSQRPSRRSAQLVTMTHVIMITTTVN